MQTRHQPANPKIQAERTPVTTIAPAKAAFDGVKDWPTPGPAVAGMGHNAPPLDEMIVMELNEALDAKQGFRARVADIIAKGADPAPCEDDDRAGRYGDFIRIAKACQGFIDEERTRIKKPYLDATRALDGTAKTLQDQLGDAIARVRAKLDAYAVEVARKQREEANRIAAEQEALRQKAAAEAEAERQRLQAIENERAVREQREAAPVEVAPPEPVFVPPAPAAEAPVFRGDLGSRVGVKTIKVVTITDVKKLPKAILAHPRVQEAILAVVNARVKSGETNITGIEITEQTVSSVR